MQAFYGAGATLPFFASTVASPPPPPFLLGGQHPIMPPYGTPVLYPVLYPPGRVYGHPNMTPGNVHGNAESDGKATERKDRDSSKKTKDSNSLSVGETGDGGKATSGSGNDIGTQSAERSEGSSNARDSDNKEYSVNKKGSFDQMLADGLNTPNSAIPPNFQISIHSNPVVSVPVTDLNIGMDLWNASPAGSGSRKSRRNLPGVSPIVTPGVSPIVAPSAIMNDQRIRDEREWKRQQRKLSNRESARRSRMRKQAECEELRHRVETLSDENRALREELQRLSEECQRLAAENNLIKEELTEKWGSVILQSKSEDCNPATTNGQARGNQGKN